MNVPRHRVFLTHIAISATLMLMLLSVMMLSWYPNGLFGVAGGWAGLKILLPIDMVLGPALTLLFYKPGKKSAVFDLSAIACVQIAALSFGVFAVYSQHPHALVLAEGALRTLTQKDYQVAVKTIREDKKQVHAPNDLDSNSPPIVVAKPYTRENYGQYLESILNGGLELAYRADRYQDLDASRATFLAARLTHQKIAESLGEDYNKSYDYLPLRSMHGKGIAVFSKDSGVFIRALPLQDAPIAAALVESN